MFMKIYGTTLIILSNSGINKAWSNVVTNTEVNDYAVRQGIQWKFIVELVPCMGGFYERMVGLTKMALWKTEKQLVTVLTEVEAVVNSCPQCTWMTTLISSCKFPPTSVDDDINCNLVLTHTSHMINCIV